MGLWSVTREGARKFGNAVKSGFNKSVDWLSKAENIGKVADFASNAASLFGPVGTAIGAGIQGTKKLIAANTDENSAWGRFARSGAKDESKKDDSYKPPLMIGRTTTGQGSYSTNTQSSGGYGGGRGRYRHSRSLR